MTLATPGAPPGGRLVPAPPLLRFRAEVRSAAQHAALAAAPLPAGLREGRPSRIIFRDLYLDTADSTLRKHGISCRLRIGSDDRRLLSVVIGAPPGMPAVEPERIEALVKDSDPWLVVAGNTAPARRLRAVVDPGALAVRVELEVDRWSRAISPDWLRRPAVTFNCDTVSGRGDAGGIAFHQLSVRRMRGRGDEVAQLARWLAEEHGLTPGAAGARERAETLVKWRRRDASISDSIGSGWLHRVPTTEGERAVSEFLDPEVSLVAFQERVLALAEREDTPLRERLRFLAIVSSNLDEFYTVRVAGLREANTELREEAGSEGATVTEQLEAIVARVSALVERQSRCYTACAAALASHGVHVSRWDTLGDAAQAALRERFQDEILPALTPMALTLAPGHPLPHVPHLSLSLALMLREHAGARAHYAELELPEGLPRFLEHPREAGGVDAVPLEEVIRANLDLVYPHVHVEQAFAFRVTRSGALALDENGSDDLLEAMTTAAANRPGNPAVRIEVEQAMPQTMRGLLLESLRREPGVEGATIDADLVQDVRGLLDLRGLDELSLPFDASLEYPYFEGRDALPAGPSIFSLLHEGDRLVHHPFERFSSSVVRFLREAADDPEVVSIKVTLYRIGESSQVMEALTDAAKHGKDVAVFVELKARFDEERNVKWAKALRKAGGRVVHGIVGLKNHSKVALVVRREEGKLHRYVHVGTGNYNGRTATLYTDLSLLSANPELGADVAELFNELTGSSRAPHPLPRGSLVAPTQLLPSILEQVEYEAANARAGRPAGIRIKVNGLADPEVVRALYRASQAGVAIDLVVRGLCTLRPGVPRMSERIRVVSVLGRFLEHSRIYRFENAGDPLYYIGSADLRPRNLRRRVELLAPVTDAANRAMLDRLLELYLEDETGWELRADGEFVQRAGGMSAQQQLLKEP